jgi:hypothetical protein
MVAVLCFSFHVFLIRYNDFAKLRQAANGSVGESGEYLSLENNVCCRI